MTELYETGSTTASLPLKETESLVDEEALTDEQIRLQIEMYENSAQGASSAQKLLEEVAREGLATEREMEERERHHKYEDERGSALEAAERKRIEEIEAAERKAPEEVTPNPSPDHNSDSRSA